MEHVCWRYKLLIVVLCLASTSLEAESQRDCNAAGRIADFRKWAAEHKLPPWQEHDKMESLLKELLLCMNRHGADKMNKRVGCALEGMNLKVNDVVLVGNGGSLVDRPLGPDIDRFPEVMRFNNVKTRGFEPMVGTRTTILFLGSLSEVCRCDHTQKKQFNMSVASCCTDADMLKFWGEVYRPEKEGRASAGGKNNKNPAPPARPIKVIIAGTYVPAFVLTSPHAPRTVRDLEGVWRFMPWPSGALANKVLDKLSRAFPGLTTRFDKKTTLRNGMYAIMLLLECGIRPTLAGFDVGRNPAGYMHHYYPRPEEPAARLTGQEAAKAREVHQHRYHNFDKEEQVLQELLADNLIKLL
eukprot:jgi/Mesvir1/29122/Mv18425-RA.1